MSIYKAPDLSKFPDCYGLSIMGKCSRLTLFYCQGKECAFKQSKEEYSVLKQSAQKRLASLSISKQIRIAKKYYGGSMPWKEDETMAEKMAESKNY